MNNKKVTLTSRRIAQILPLALIFLVSCSEVDVNFQVNGQSALTGNETEEELQKPDTSNMLRVFVGDTVIFRNTSEPEGNINEQRWDVDGDDLIDEEFNGISGFKTVFTKPDRFMAALWVNDAEVPVRKWIEVQGDFEVFDEILPSISFVNPSSRVEEFDTRDFNLKASLTEIYSSDSIVLKVNGEVKEFFFDEYTGELEQDLSLERGDNEIALYAYTEDGGVYSEMAIVSYKPDDIVPSPKKSTYVAPVATKKPEPKSELDDVFAAKKEPKNAVVNEKLTDFAKAGYRAEGITEACRSDLIESYSFTITPSKLVRIDDFVLFNTVCGTLAITISSPEGELMSTNETLTGGKSQISFGLYTDEVFLQKDVTYTFAIKPSKGNANCGSSESPKLVDTKECSPELRKKSHLTTNFKGKSIIHDITYSY